MNLLLYDAKPKRRELSSNTNENHLEGMNR